MASGRLIVLAFAIISLFAPTEVKGGCSMDVNCDVCPELRYIKRELADIKKSLSRLPVCLSEKPVSKDCSDILANGEATSGVYTIYPVAGDSLDVYCDMETDGGGWTVFQRRQDGSVDFYRDWESYRQGFGDVDGEFWLGNDNLHRLLAQGEYRLRVDLEDFEGNTAYAEYDTFNVADGTDNYRLTVTDYSGTAGNSLGAHSNQQFSTKDVDHDQRPFSCAQKYSGAWWYKACHYSNLNGLYLGGKTDQFATGIVWYHWKGHYYSLKRTEMKFKAN